MISPMRAQAMSKAIRNDLSKGLRAQPEDAGHPTTLAERRPADTEMARVLGTTPFRMGLVHSATPIDLLERTAHSDPVTSRLLLSAADVLGGNEALDTLFRLRLRDLLATRLLASHTASPATFQPTMGGLSPMVLRRAIKRLRSDSDADVSLAALASDAGLSRFHFCRAFKESTGLSPHAWLRKHRLEQAMNMLRDTDESMASIAAALGYSSQTAFAAAFRRLTNETPSNWRRRAR